MVNGKRYISHIIQEESLFGILYLSWYSDIIFITSWKPQNLFDTQLIATLHGFTYKDKGLIGETCLNNRFQKRLSKLSFHLHILPVIFIIFLIHSRTTFLEWLISDFGEANLEPATSRHQSLLCGSSNPHFSLPLLKLWNFFLLFYAHIRP